MNESNFNGLSLGKGKYKCVRGDIAVYSILLLTLTLSFAPKASAKSNDAELQRLAQAYKKLRARPLNPEYKANYFDAFPKDSRQFKRLFNSTGRADTLADTESAQNYLFQLEYLLDYHSDAVLDRLISLAAQLKFDSAAAQTAQMILIKIALNYSNQFAAQFKNLSSSKQSAVVRFMTDGKKGPPSGVRSLIKLLQRTNHAAVADKLQAGL